MEAALRSLRFALRSWWRQPVMATAVIVCLGVGIGVTAVVFSLINGMLLRPLPYKDPGGIYLLWHQFPARGIDLSSVSGWEYLDFRELKETFAEVGGSITWPYNLTSIEPPERVLSGRVSASLFRVLGTQPSLGRVFTDEEEERGERVVVLSHGLWQRAFGGDPGVLGRTLSLAQEPYTIIGVLPQDLRPMPIGAELWVPLVPNPNVPRDLRGVLLFVRLQEGIGLGRAERDLDVVEGRFRREHPDLYPPDSGWQLVLQPLHEALVGSSRGRLWVSFGAVLLVLLLACANVANLLLVRALAKQKEYALRTALGAHRGILLRHLLGENLLPVLAGGAFGWWLAEVGLRVVMAVQPGDMLRLEEVVIDTRVFLFTFALTLISGLIVGLYPAWRIAGQSLSQPLNEGGRSATGKRHAFFRWIVVGELTMAVLVLVGTALMWRSFTQLQKTDPGYRTSDLLTMMIGLPPSEYSEAGDRARFQQQLESRLVERFGADRVGLVSHIPLDRSRLGGPILAEDQEMLPHLVNPEVGWCMVNPTFFRAMGIELRQGRAFDDRDRDDAPMVVMIDSNVAQRLWPGKSPLGKRLRFDASHDNAWRTVVGVVEPIKQRALAAEVFEQIYVPYSQMPAARVGIVLRMTGGIAPVVAEVRAILREINPRLPISNVESIEHLIERSLSGSRFLFTLFATFGLIALVLTAAGLYGVIAYTTSQRTGEIGLRQALGACRKDIFWLVLGEGFRIAMVGIVLGSAVAFFCAITLANLLANMAFGVESTNPGIFIGVAAVLLGLALLASFLPALRAARLDPVVALQHGVVE